MKFEVSVRQHCTLRQFAQLYSVTSDTEHIHLQHAFAWMKDNCIQANFTCEMYKSISEVGFLLYRKTQSMFT